MKKQAWKYMITIDLKKHHTRFSSINRIIIQPGYFNYIQYIPMISPQYPLFIPIIISTPD